MTRTRIVTYVKKEREEKLLQGIQSTNGSKSHVGAKKADGTALEVTTQENAIKETFDKRFALSLDFDFFKHLVYPYGLKEDLIVRIKFFRKGNFVHWRYLNNIQALRNFARI